MLSHGSLIFQLQQMQAIQDICAQNPKPNAQVTSVQLAALSMAQTGGLNRSCLRPFLAPATYVILNEWKVEDALDAISRFAFLLIHPRLLTLLIHQIQDYLRSRPTLDVESNHQLPPPQGC